MKIRTKLNILAMLTVLLCGLLSGYVYYQTTTSEAKMVKNYEKMQYTFNITQNLNSIRNLYGKYIFDKSESTVNEIIKIEKKTLLLIQQTESGANEKQAENLMREMMLNGEQFIISANALDTNGIAQNFAGLNMNYENLEKIFENSHLEYMGKFKISEAVDITNVYNNYEIMGIITGFAVILFFIIIIGFSVSKSYKKAVANIDSAAGTGSGISGFADEIGAITAASYELVENARFKLDKAVNKLRTAETGLAGYEEAAIQIRNEIGEIMTRLDEYKNVSNLEEINEGKEIQKDIFDSIKIDEGIRPLEKLKSGIAAVSDHAALCFSAAGEFEKRGADTGEVISYINDISAKINFLAISTSIEAARMGEVGRGVTVIADEMNKLSEKTKSSAKEMEIENNRIKEETGKLIKKIEKIQIEINEIGRETENALQSYADIRAGISKLKEDSKEADGTGDGGNLKKTELLDKVETGLAVIGEIIENQPFISMKTHTEANNGKEEKQQVADDETDAIMDIFTGSVKKAVLRK